MTRRPPKISSSTQWYIYTLSDPRMASARLSVRYVGYTVSANGRLADHIEEAKCGWILQVLMSGFVPVIRIVDQGLGHSWREAERFWIRFYREEVGADLTNLTDGGYGALGYRFSDESRRLRSERNRQPEMVERRSRSLSSFLKNLKTIDPEAFADRVGHLTRHTSRTNVTRCLEGRCEHKSHQHRRILCEAA